MTGSIVSWAEMRGYRVAWGRPQVLEEIRNEFENRRACCELDGEFYRTNLCDFRHLADADLSEWHTLLVFALSRPGHFLEFETESGLVRADVPPTYRFYQRTGEAVLEDLRATWLPKGGRIELLSAPLKAVAARAGLVEYGRNNVTYAEGMGSYHQLVGCLTDVRLEELWKTVGPRKRRTERESRSGPQTQEPGSLSLAAECRNCHACRDACPNGAISGDRVLLRAEHCLTLLNENAGDWPDWLPAWAHNCLIGCLLCQSVCPKNRGLYRREPAGESFNREETVGILASAGEKDESFRASVRDKLAWAGLSTIEPVLSRNLRALLTASALRTRASAGRVPDAGGFS